MSWLDKILPARIRAAVKKKSSVPEGLWHKCVNCDAVIYKAEYEKNLKSKIWKIKYIEPIFDNK